VVEVCITNAIKTLFSIQKECTEEQSLAKTIRVVTANQT